MSTPRHVRAAACQMRIDIDDPPTPEAITEVVGQAAAAGARLIVLPELATSGYAFRSPQEASSRAEAPDGPTARRAQDISARYDCVVVLGFPEVDGGAVYNSALIADRGRLLGVYRKTHLWDREKLCFTPGRAGPLVVETSIGWVGVMICYDAEFPEWVRIAVQRGAEVLAVPVNWPLMPRPTGQDAAEVAKIRAASAYYRIPMVVADRCGRERGVDWIGGSLITDAEGYALAGPATPHGLARPTIVSADIDIAAGRDKSLTDLAHALGDRRPELYRETP
ncbi:MAG: nitrilase-related carbon-nitrogen hydrolase [Brachybacterium sp.]|nr:nitrilase-related carbon-nitrogen hydrolase [Brachybacterium sp.]